MARRTIVTSLTAAALIGAPTLCVAGIVRHACESAPQRDCYHGADCDHPESGSHHGGDCPDDPCSLIAVLANRHADVVHEIAPPTMVCLPDLRPPRAALLDAMCASPAGPPSAPDTSPGIDTTRLLI